MNYILTFLQLPPSQMPQSGGNWTFTISLIILIILIVAIDYGIRLYKKKRRKNNPNLYKDDSLKFFDVSKTTIFGVIGGFAGIFFSIIFQDFATRSMGMALYIRNLSKVEGLNIFIGIIVFSLLGMLIGYLLDKTKLKND